MIGVAHPPVLETAAPASEIMTPHHIESKDDLVRYLEDGCTPPADWRIGTEHEKFVYCKKQLTAIPYAGDHGIKAILEGLSHFDGWHPVIEKGNIIALKGDDKSSVTLEPGGQLELSGAPLRTIHETCKEAAEHHAQIKQVSDPLGVGYLGMGFTPDWRREDIHWMPKGRYKIMREYMPKVGTMGLDMMLRTATVQVNLDFASEQCMVRKYRLSLALQPLATALWANSPLKEGQLTGKQSTRSFAWTDTDNNRCGMLPFVFEDGMGFERYVDYMLDVPMYFVYRDGQYLDAAGLSFRDFLAGKLDILPGEKPTLADWEDHMTTCFPEVRLKKYLEMRGSDTGGRDMICALPAFWVGLLYDQTAMGAAWDVVKNWAIADMAQLRADVVTQGLQAKIQGRTLQDIALEILQISENGLKNRNFQNAAGEDETKFLSPLWGIAQSGQTLAQWIATNYQGIWKGDMHKVYAASAY
jgi:glutamate--cysteine ligase